MAAVDAFHSFNSGLSLKEKVALKEMIRIQTEDLLAARSEDARERLVQQYIREANKLLRDKK